MRRARPPLRVVLLDADGVLQRHRPGLVRGLLRLGGPRFLLDALRAEVGCLTGERDFPDALAEAMRRHRVRGTVAEVAARWLDIVVDPRRLALVDELRGRGVRVALATNQHRFRGLHMREVLRLDDHFDAAYYSYELGVAKPDAGYFTRILDDLGEPPGSVLFVDDLPGNVRAARAVGIDARLHLWRTGVAGLRRTLTSRL
ncbi:MAG: HAD-IA family hydrolase [Micropruina sp.]|uniref:HAD-IA family hydrolase n=1 Tax=Micropruina sp. TaxID=2737536 RepID=UPI0039E2CB19